MTDIWIIIVLKSLLLTQNIQIVFDNYEVIEERYNFFSYKATFIILKYSFELTWSYK